MTTGLAVVRVLHLARMGGAALDDEARAGVLAGANPSASEVRKAGHVEAD